MVEIIMIWKDGTVKSAYANGFEALGTITKSFNCENLQTVRARTIELSEMRQGKERATNGQ